MYLGNVAGSTYGQLYFNGTQTLGGTGTVVFGPNGSNAVYETAYRSDADHRQRDHHPRQQRHDRQLLLQRHGGQPGDHRADDSGGLTTPSSTTPTSAAASTGSTAATIGASGVTNPAPEAVYQTYRDGAFSYTLTGLTPSASYTLRLHFADPSFDGGRPAAV